MTFTQDDQLLTFATARDLVLRHGTNCQLHVDDLLSIHHSPPKAHGLAHSIDVIWHGETDSVAVLAGVWRDGEPPMIVSYRPGPWRRLLQQTADMML